VAKLNSYLIFITYLVSISFPFQFPSCFHFVRYILGICRYISLLLIRSLTTLCYVPHDSHSPTATLDPRSSLLFCQGPRDDHDVHVPVTPYCGASMMHLDKLP
jgi:hypothetical protein